MFTGIVEETGIVKNLRHQPDGTSIYIQAKTVLEGTAPGDSIAVNGVCLTVTALHGDGFEAFIMGETKRRSGLGQFHPGDLVNLERALALSGRLGGHIVTGHVDDLGAIEKIHKEGAAHWFTVRPPARLMRYIVEKGSITIDGISLTVAAVDDTVFQVSIIPHTQDSTTLLKKKAGDMVNLECDIIGKYVEKLGRCEPVVSEKTGAELDAQFLQKYGFL